MAAAVENATRIVRYFGDTPVEICDVTFTSSGDTFTSEFAKVMLAEFNPSTATGYATIGLTFSNNIVTISSGGTVTGKIVVYGDVT